MPKQSKPAAPKKGKSAPSLSSPDRKASQPPVTVILPSESRVPPPGLPQERSPSTFRRSGFVPWTWHVEPFGIVQPGASSGTAGRISGWRRYRTKCSASHADRASSQPGTTGKGRPCYTTSSHRKSWIGTVHGRAFQPLRNCASGKRSRAKSASPSSNRDSSTLATWTRRETSSSPKLNPHSQTYQADMNGVMSGAGRTLRNSIVGKTKQLEKLKRDREVSGASPGTIDPDSVVF